MSSEHEERALSFGQVAEDYEATRPGWPLEPFTQVLEHFGVRERPDVVDIAAGRDYAVPATIDDPAIIGEIAGALGKPGENGV